MREPTDPVDYVYCILSIMRSWSIKYKKESPLEVVTFTYD